MVLASSSSEDEAGFNKGGLGYDWPEGHEPWSETLGDLRGAEMGTDARVRLHTKNEKEVSLAGEGMEGLRKISDSLGWTWGCIGDLPEAPREEWQPGQSSEEWADIMFGGMPQPLQRWIIHFEGLGKWQDTWRAQQTVLPKLRQYATCFEVGRRRGEVENLFGSLGLLVGKDADMFQHLLCKFDKKFGHVQFKVGQDVGSVRFVLAMGDCFYSLIDEEGLSESLFWGPEPAVADPENFQAGGVHSDSAKKAWQDLPGVSSHVLHWVNHKVWFKKKVHVVDQSATNAAELKEGSRSFSREKFEFLDAKIEELEKCGAVKKLPKGVLPDVITRLSLAPKPGPGKESWRIIMDMRPENERHFSKKVRMETLAHFHAIFGAMMLLFSLDLKSAYFSVGVDERVARTMGFEWRGQFYKFTCLPFGWKLSPYAFVKMGRQIMKKWRAMGPGNWKGRFEGWRDAPQQSAGVACMLYIDDSAGGHEDFGLAVWARNAMMVELEQLGFSLSAKGSLLPFPQLEFLGMLAHLACPSPSWFLPERKEKALIDLAQELVKTHEEGRAVLCRKAAKIVGKVSAATRAVPIAKILFREINACIYASSIPDWGGSIILSEAAVVDLLWIVKNFVGWNGQCAPIWCDSRVHPVDCVLVQDAGPRAIGFQLGEVEGILAQDAPGGLPMEGSRSVALREKVVESVVGMHQLRCTQGTIELRDEEADMHHVHKELLGVVLTIASRRLELQNKRVCILVDATTSVAYISNWGGPSMICNRLVRGLWGICATFNIRIVQVSHIAGEVMISCGVDALSRPYRFARGGEADRDEWRLRGDVLVKMQDFFQVTFTVDRMASRANRRCQQFASHSSVDPESMGPSTFALDWARDGQGVWAENYCFPPFCLIPRVIQHVKECRARAVVVMPLWPSQHWWVSMSGLCEQWMELPADGAFERVKDGQWEGVKARSFTPIACMLDGRRIGG